MSKRNECQVCAEITRIYLDPMAGSSVAPLAQVEFLFENGHQTSALLSADQLTVSALKKAVPRLRAEANLRPLAVDLTTQFYNMLDSGSQHTGLLLPQNGLQRLPDRSSLYVMGDRVLGTAQYPYLLRPPVDYHIITTPIGTPLALLFSELCYASPIVLLAVVFLFTTLLRSWIGEIALSWQGVLNIVGKQGLGKTTLARLITDWICDKQNRPAMLYSAGSTASAIRETMVNARDLPLVVDDLCLSASPKLQQKYRDLGAQLVREGANASGISKKCGNQTLTLHCSAGIIMTAEFALENDSDITRCIFLPLEKKPDIPASLTPELIGAGCQAFIEWFLSHEAEADDAFQDASMKEISPSFHPRVWGNYTVLKTVFQLALRAAREDGLSDAQSDAARQQYQSAVEQSLQYQQNLRRSLDRRRKKGNLAAVLMSCYENDTFTLTKKIEKLDKRDGILWKGNYLCLRRDALERTVRIQDGYQDYTINQIVRELKDMGALTIQEEDTAQVRLKKGTPRVYRINLDILEHYQEEY